MLEAIREALKVQSETLEFCGRKVIVRELNAATSLPLGDLAEEGAARQKQAERGFMLMFVRSIFWVDGEGAGDQVFTDDDIAEIEQGAKRALAPLVAAVNRVNGLDTAVNEKK